MAVRQNMYVSLYEHVHIYKHILLRVLFSIPKFRDLKIFVFGISTFCHRQIFIFIFYLIPKLKDLKIFVFGIPNKFRNYFFFILLNTELLMFLFKYIIFDNNIIQFKLLLCNGREAQRLFTLREKFTLHSINDRINSSDMLHNGCLHINQ